MIASAFALILLIMAASGLALYLFTRRYGRARGTRAAVQVARRGELTAPGSQRPGNQLPILDFDALLARTGTTGFLHQIENRTGFARENFELDCLPVLRQVAEYVQLFPASEAHHHAQEGGLLIHLLETTAYALHFREGVELPVEASPEERARLKHRWTYGVMLAALLHDVGKPLADLRITLYGADPTTGTAWHAFAGAATAIPDLSHYTVDFASPTERDYDEHRRLAYSLAQQLIPQRTRLWLAEDPALIRELAAYLSGEPHTGAIARIVTRADAESVRNNLRFGPRTRFASARVVPLIERLMAGLRRMLAEGGHLPLNKPGAAGWVYRNEIWFVSKRLADACRDYLIQHEQRHEGAPGIPENNERLFDTWGEYGACVVDAGTNRAVWTARVEMAGFDQRLTMLRFPLGKLYANPGQYPAEMAGRIVVLSRHEAGEATFNEDVQAGTEAVATAADQEPAARDTAGAATCVEVDCSVSKPETAEPECVDSSPATIEQAYATDNDPAALLDEEDSAARELADESRPMANPPIAPSTPVAPAGPRTAAGLLGNTGKAPSQAKESAMRFFAWVQQGVAEGTLKYNAPDARIHFVPEGMLLVSPATFRDFAAVFGDVGHTTAPGANGKERLGNGIQNAVKRSGLVVPAAKGNYLHRYQILRSGSQGGSFLNCFLVPRPELLFNPVPPVNPLLKRFSAEGPQDG